MNIGDLWNPENYDDPDLTPEELAETLSIHKRHRESENVNTRKTKRNINIQPHNRRVH